MSQKSKNVSNDDRYTIRDIAIATGIAPSRLHFILTDGFWVQRHAKWVPHIWIND